MTDEVGIEVGRMTFRVDWAEFDKTAQRYCDNTTSAPQATAGTIVRLARLYLEEFIDGHNYSLSVWGWLQRLALHLGDEHDLELYFASRPVGRGVLEFRIISPNHYEIIFAGVKIGLGVKDPVGDPVNDRALPPEM